MVWAWKTAFIYVCKDVQLHLYAFFCLHPTNVRKTYQCVRLSSFHLFLLLFLGAKGVSREKPQYRASFLREISVRNTTARSATSSPKNQFSSRHGRRLYWLVRSSSAICRAHVSCQLILWLFLYAIWLPTGRETARFATSHGRHQQTCNAPPHNLRRFSSDTPWWWPKSGVQNINSAQVKRVIMMSEARRTLFKATKMVTALVTIKHIIADTQYV